MLQTFLLRGCPSPGIVLAALSCIAFPAGTKAGTQQNYPAANESGQSACPGKPTGRGGVRAALFSSGGVFLSLCPCLCQGPPPPAAASLECSRKEPQAGQTLQLRLESCWVA